MSLPIIALMMAERRSVETGKSRSAIAKGEYMNHLNSILIEGNLIRDPLIRQSPYSGRQVCNMTIASNRYFNDSSGKETGKEVCFFDIESWGWLAESCSNLGHKGRGVRIVGRLRQDRWTGSDGKNHARIIIVAEHVEFRPEFKQQQQEEIPSMNFEAEVPPAEEGIEEPVDVA